MRCMALTLSIVWSGLWLLAAAAGQAAEIRANNEPAQLDIRPAGEHSIRVTLKPISFKPDFPFTPGAGRARVCRASDQPARDLAAGQGPGRQPECRSSAQLR